jgi:LmbE family N-acetylglucosaminyl deacetylase
MEEVSLLCVVAHPDDESLGFGGLLAHAAAHGVATHLITATRGEQGWAGAANQHPGATALAELRSDELYAAGAILGLRSIQLFAYPDGGLAEVPAAHIQAHIAAVIRQIRPNVVVTFGPEGATGHPDHIAISQFTTAAIVQAACHASAHAPAHQVQKLYYLAESAERNAGFDAIFGPSAMSVAGRVRHVPGWPLWAISTRINTRPYWRTVWNAVRCHRSQLPMLDALDALPEAIHRNLWGTQELYRVFSTTPTSTPYETDLFAGITAAREVGR